MWKRFINRANEKLNLWTQRRRLPPAPPSSTIEIVIHSPPQSINGSSNSSTVQRGAHEHANNNCNQGLATAVDGMQWLLLMVGVCFTMFSAVLQALQPTTLTPPTSREQMVCIAMVISYTALVVSAYTSTIYKRAAAVGIHVGILIGSTAFMVAFVSNLPTSVMVTSIAIYSLGIIIVILAHVFKPNQT